MKCSSRFIVLATLVGPVVDDLLLRLGQAGRVGDDERRPGLVDEDAVGLVHDGEVVVALDARVQLGRRPPPGIHGRPERRGRWPCPPRTLSRSRRKSKPNSEAVP